MADTLKIASWNINSVRFRIEIVERFLKEAAPEVATGLQIQGLKKPAPKPEPTVN